MSTDPAGPGDAPGRILIVDDDAFLLRALNRVLTPKGHRVVTATGGEAALATLDGDRDFDLVLFDMNMPPMDGPEFFARAAGLCPELRGRFVVTSGDAGEPEVLRLARESGVPVLAKPYTAADVRALLAALRAGR